MWSKTCNISSSSESDFYLSCQLKVIQTWDISAKSIRYFTEKRNFFPTKNAQEFEKLERRSEFLIENARYKLIIQLGNFFSIIIEILHAIKGIRKSLDHSDGSSIIHNCL